MQFTSTPTKVFIFIATIITGIPLAGNAMVAAQNVSIPSITTPLPGVNITTETGFYLNWTVPDVFIPDNGLVVLCYTPQPDCNPYLNLTYPFDVSDGTATLVIPYIVPPGNNYSLVLQWAEFPNITAVPISVSNSTNSTS